MTSPDFHALIEQAFAPIVPAPVAFDRYDFEMGCAALALRPRLKTFPVIDGSRRMLGDRTPRQALDLKIIRKEDQQ